MSYLVLARKYRSRDFESLVGQEHVVQALSNALEQQRLHHAYLFTGTRGVGKTTTAKLLAKAMNCVQGPTTDPCGTCEECVAIAEGRSMNVVEIDAASNTGVQDVRDLIIDTVAAALRSRPNASPPCSRTAATRGRSTARRNR